MTQLTFRFQSCSTGLLLLVLMAAFQSLHADIVDDLSTNTKDIILVYTNEFEDEFELWTGDKTVWQMGAPVYGPTNLCANDSMCIGTILDNTYPDFVNAELISPPITLAGIQSGNTILLSMVNWFEVDIHDLVKVSISYAQGQFWTDPELLFAQSGRSFNWQPIELNISKYGGETIRLHFQIEQDETIEGSGSGWYIDDFQIVEIR